MNAALGSFLAPPLAPLRASAARLLLHRDVGFGDADEKVVSAAWKANNMPRDQLSFGE